ncbi:unnamed protein product [Lactuca saligna]|uniref:Uncharacterized protein n=1 Tax=Lactuca saligna TaxID=75948 RepID=A0AA35YV97_LACSI|nr:unnamed protein product [Lactuca saligna]
MHLTRDDDNGQAVVQYIKVLFVNELVKFGYNEWFQLLELVKKQKGKYTKELRLVLEKLIKKVKGLDSVLKTPTKPSSNSGFALVHGKRASLNVKFLLPYGTKVIDNYLPININPIQNTLIHKHGHGIFYMDESQCIYFQHSNDLAKVST